MPDGMGEASAIMAGSLDLVYFLMGLLGVYIRPEWTVREGEASREAQCRPRC